MKLPAALSTNPDWLRLSTQRYYIGISAKDINRCMQMHLRKIRFLIMKRDCMQDYPFDPLRAGVSMHFLISIYSHG